MGCRWPGWKWIASWKNEATFFKFIAFVSENSLKFWLWFIFSCKFTCYLPFSVPWVFCVRQRHVVLSWGYFDPKTWKSPWRSPCKWSYFGKNDCFYQLFQRKQFWPRHTALSRFCQHKVISQSKHTVLSSFCKNMTPLGTKQNIHECLLKEALSPFLMLL